MDSYMYQTVGHNVVAQYSELLECPLYRQAITGSAVTQKLDYAPVDKDETEDLYQLLKTVMKNHPTVEAVSVGAILSSYQRTRVENVCQRLGLTSLSYLWQRDQVELLDEIVRSKLDARIIKVAGMGLTPQKHIGKSLAEIQQELLRLHERFGLHPCGEGGEYETLVLGGPSTLFKKRFSIEKLEIEEDKADVGFARIEVALMDQEELDGEVIKPDLLEEEFSELMESLVAKEDNQFDSSHALTVGAVPSKSGNSENMVFAGYSGKIEHVMEELKTGLLLQALTFEHVTSSSLILNDMGDFVDVNRIYSSYFTEPIPPARVCISARLPEGTQCQLTVTVTRDLSSKTGLHVQSRSYWAPANIGPYSQSVSSGEVTYLSGQIPLVPATMDLIEEPKEAAVLSLQHLVRVAREVKSKLSVVMGFTNSQNLLPIAQETIDQYDSTLPAIIATVKTLPRNAPVEWTALAYKEGYYLGQREAVRVVPVGENSTISSLLGPIPHLDVLSVSLYTSNHLLSNDIQTALEIVQCDSVHFGGNRTDVAVVRYRKEVDIDSD